MSYRYTIETENPIVTDGNKMFNCKDGKLRLKIVDANPWHTGTPTEAGDYICAFRMLDGSVEYGWCCWDGTGWDIMCDYYPEDTPIVGWQKIEPYKETD